MFNTDLRVNDAIKIGDIVVTLKSKKGEIAKIAVEAPKDVKIELQKQKKS
jgi:sRNA-binding carbon storage regulator CsrA